MSLVRFRLWAFSLPISLIIEYGALAQLVEHLTFNQVVRGSNPRTLIVEQAILLVLFVILTYILITPMLCKRFSTDIICEKV